VYAITQLDYINALDNLYLSQNNWVSKLFLHKNKLGYSLNSIFFSGEISPDDEFKPSNYKPGISINDMTYTQINASELTHRTGVPNSDINDNIILIPLFKYNEKKGNNAACDLIKNSDTFTKYIEEKLNNYIEEEIINNYPNLPISLGETIDIPFSGNTSFIFFGEVGLGGARIKGTIRLYNPLLLPDIGQGSLSVSNSGIFTANKISLVDIKIVDVWDYNYFNSVLSFMDIVIPDANLPKQAASVQFGAYRHNNKSVGSIFKMEFEFNYDSFKKNFKYPFSVDLTASFKNSNVSGVKTFLINNSDTTLLGVSNSRGIENINIIPNSTFRDTFLFSSSRFHEILYVLDSTDWFQKKAFGLLPKIETDKYLSYSQISCLDGANIVTDKDSVQIEVSSKGMSSYKYFRENKEIILPASQNTFWYPLLIGENKLEVIIYGSDDSILLEKQIYYIRPNEKDSLLKSVTVKSVEEFYGTEIYVENEFYGKLEQSPKNHNILKDTKYLKFIKTGYQPKTIWIPKNDTIISLNLNRIEYKSNYTVLNFSKQDVLYWNDITIQDYTKKSKLNVQRLYEGFGYGTKHFSDLAIFKQSTNKKGEFRAYIAYDYPEIPEDYYIIIFDGDIIKKVFPTDFNDTIVFEEDVQLLKLNNFMINDEFKVGIALKQAPILKKLEPITILSDSSYSFSPIDVCFDSDSVPNDMYFDEKSIKISNKKINYKFKNGNLTISCKKPLTGEGNIIIDVVHDEKAVTAKIPLKFENRPAVKNITIKGAEDRFLYFSESKFKAAYTDYDGDPPFAVLFLKFPKNGELYFNTKPLIPNQEIAISQLNQLYYNPNKDFFGFDTVEYTIHDGKYFAKQPADVFLDIAPVNDIPDFEILIPTMPVKENFSDTVFVYIIPGYVPPNEKNQKISYTVNSNDRFIANFNKINDTTLSFTAMTDENGMQKYTITAFDGVEKVQKSFTLVISDVNNPPIFSLEYNELDEEEDFGTTTIFATLQLPPNDEIDQEITWTYKLIGSGIVKNVEFEKINKLKKKIIITSKEDLFGTQKIVFKTDDNQAENRYAYDTLDIHIKEVNDPPAFYIEEKHKEIDKIEDFSNAQKFNIKKLPQPKNERDNKYNYTIYSVNQDSIVEASIDEKTGRVTIKSLPNRFIIGKEIFVVQAVEPLEKEPNTFTDTFTVSVSPVNDLPDFTVDIPKNIDEDFESFPVQAYQKIIPWGEEQQIIWYNVRLKGEQIIDLHIDSLTGVLSFSSIKNRWGTQEFFITAFDGQDSISKKFTIKVNEVNDPNTFSVIDSLVLLEDFTGTEIVEINKHAPPYKEKDGLTYKIENISDITFINLKLNQNKGTIELTKKLNLSDSIEVIIVGYDHRKAEYRDTLYMKVRSVNDPPDFRLDVYDKVMDEDFGSFSFIAEIISIPENELEQEITWEYNLIDDDKVNVSINMLSKFKCEFTVHSIKDTNGIQKIQIIATDNQQENHTSKDTILLDIKAVNDPPVHSIANEYKYINKQEDFIEPVIFDLIRHLVPEDEKDETLIYSIISHEASSIVNSSISETGQVTIANIPNRFGPDEIIIKIDDQQDKYNIDTIHISVYVDSINDVPEILIDNPTPENEDFKGEMSIIVQTEDSPWGEEWQKLLFSLVSIGKEKIVDAKLDSITGEIRFSALPDRYGEESFELTVTDGFDSNTIKFSITVDEINDEPVFEPEMDTVYLYQDFTGKITNKMIFEPVWGESNQKLTYSFAPKSLPFVNFNGNIKTGQVSFTSKKGEFGEGKITITLDDKQKENSTFSKDIHVIVRKLIIPKDTTVYISYGEIKTFFLSDFFDDLPEYALKNKLVQFELNENERLGNIVVELDRYTGNKEKISLFLTSGFFEFEEANFTITATYKNEVITNRIIVKHISSSGIINIKESEITLFPNPVGDNKLIINNSSNSVPEILWVIDVTGKIIVRSEESSIKQRFFNLETSTWKAGEYFVAFKFGETVIVKTVIK